MLKRILTLLFLLCFSVSIQAQVIATTEDGKKVVLNSDGTWLSLEDYMKSLNGGAPTPKPKGKKEESTPAAKRVTMADFKCGEISVERMNTQSQEMEKSLKEEITISEEEEEKKFTTSLRANKNKTFVWDFRIRGQQGCAAQTPMVRVTFQDGSNIRLKVQNDFVCDSDVSVFLSKGLGNKNDLKALKGKPISLISVEARGGIIEEDLTDEQAAILQKAFNCLGGK